MKRSSSLFMVMVFFGVFICSATLCQASDWATQHVASWMVGTGAELEFDHDNNPIMVYPDRDRGKIVLAYRVNGQWQFADIDDFPSSMAYAGMPSPSLAINPQGGWGVAYYVEDSDNIMIGTIKYAFGIGLSFQKEVVKEDVSVSAQGVHRLNLKFSPQGVPCIAFLRGILDEQLCLAIKHGSNWDINVVLDSNNHPSLSSEWPFFRITGGISLAFDSQGRAVIAYGGFFTNGNVTKDKEVMQVVYFSQSPEGVRIETIDSFEQSSTDNLQFTYPSVALDSQGNIGVSYIRGIYMGGTSYNEYDLQVNFAMFNGNSWEISTVEHLTMPVYYTFLVFDRQNNPCIAYDVGDYPGEQTIHFARKIGSIWNISTISGSPSFGPEATDLAIDNNNIPYLSYSTSGEILLAQYTGEMPEVVPTEPQLSLATDGITVNLFWTTTSGAEGYTLFYAPYPDASYVGSIDMGLQTSLSADLWSGAAFYVSVQAYNGAGNSDYSNIEYFVIP